MKPGKLSDEVGPPLISGDRVKESFDVTANEVGLCGSSSLCLHYSGLYASVVAVHAAKIKP
jgi:hypothetical protein